MSETKEMSKQEIVVTLVKAGDSTRQDLKDEAGCTSGALASYLSGMRNAAKFTGVAICPMEVELEDGRKVFTVVTFSEAEAAKAERAAKTATKVSSKTPAERFDAADKRVKRCESALDKANEKASLDEDNEELQLRAQKADIELKLANIEFDKAQVILDDSAIDTVEDEIPGEEELI